MPISNFNGETFVAFVDISGFKQLMEKPERAWKALDCLYRYGYSTIKEVRNKNSQIDGIFISDSGIIFIRRPEKKQRLLNLFYR